MNYSHLIEQIAIRTWQEEDRVKRTILVLGELLTTLRDGEYVKTPIGSFRGFYRPRKAVQLPDGTWTEAGPQMQIKFRPGKMLRIDLPDSKASP